LKRKDEGQILKIKYLAINRGWHDKGQGFRVQGEGHRGQG
jgi:hypothetical protein